MPGFLKSTRKMAFTMLAVCLAFVSPADARVYRVNGSAAAGGDGGSWSAPLDEAGFAAALSGAVSGDEFWIAKGVYRPAVPALADGVTSVDQGKSFTLPNGVALYGGFAGSETAREQRDPDKHCVVLTGDLGLDDGRDARGVTLSADVIRGTNSESVLKGTNVKGVRLDGVAVSGGEGGLGGGLNLSESDVVIENCLFQGNKGTNGAAINISIPPQGSGTASLYIRDSRFLENRSTGSLGGSINTVRTEVKLFRSRFEGNAVGSGQSGNGGGISFQSNRKPGAAGLTIESCSFLNNYAGGGGGAVYAGRTPDGITIRRSLFKDNKTSHNGGALRLLQATNILVEDCLFTGNSTVIEGGAMYNSEVGGGGRGMTIRSCTFSGNRTYDDAHVTDPNKGSGGAVYNGVSSPTLVNCTFTGNEAKYGGALFNRTGSYPLLLNCTFLGNKATPQEGQGGEGSSVYNTKCKTGACKPGGGRIVAFNSIFWDGGAEEIVSGNDDDSGAALYNSIVRGGAVRDGKIVLSEVTSADPRLSSLGNHGGPVPTCLPAWTSPARDRGRRVGALTSADVLSADVFWRGWAECAIPAVDARGVARPQFGGVDIGAVELSSAPQPQPGPDPKPVPQPGPGPKPEPQPQPQPQPNPDPTPQPGPSPVPEKPITEAPAEAPMDARYDDSGAWTLVVGEVGSDGTAEVTVGVRLKPVPRRLTLIDVETKNFVEASTAVFLDGKPVAFSAAVSGAGPAGLYEYELRIRGRVREEALNGAAERCAALAAMTYMLEGDTAPTRLAFSGDGVALSGMKQRSEGTRSGGCDAGLGALALILAAVYLLRRIGCSA